MVICLVALVVFAILSIFSAKYRLLAKDAFRCVFRMITFRPCDVQLEQRIKSKVTAKLMKGSPTVARVFYKHFKAISWIFTIAFFASLIYSSYGIYNLIVYQACDPSSSTCIITGAGVSLYGLYCAYEAYFVYTLVAVLVAVVIFFIYKYSKTNE